MKRFVLLTVLAVGLEIACIGCTGTPAVVQGTQGKKIDMNAVNNAQPRPGETVFQAQKRMVSPSGPRFQTP